MVSRHVTDVRPALLRWWRRLPGPFRFGLVAATLEMAAILWLFFR